MSPVTQILQGAFQLQGLSTNTTILQNQFQLYDLHSNISLLEYGLQMGLIEQTNSGQMIMELLNVKLMSISDLIRNVLVELLMRLGVFVSATGLVKLAMESEEVEKAVEQEDKLRCFYGVFIIAHQVLNFDATSIRTLNRLLMSIAIILFSLNSYTNPCDDMKKFKHKIRHRLAIDYYLWCILFAMDLVLTCSSPVHINLEQAYGIELNISHIMLSSYCVIHLSGTMQTIGHGRLSPLIMGTPLIFLDAGDYITPVKGLFLFFYYLCFWCSDWRELVDWNHSMLCEAGVCKVLGTEKGTIVNILRKARTKFDEWRLEEGLDDDGWFILVDAPSARSTSISERADENDGSIPEEHEEEQVEELIEDDNLRLVYLQSRNPLLTSLAAVMLIVWK